MDGTVRNVQHLIMLGVLSAQSADEPAAFAPRDPHRLHVATLPQRGSLAPEEPPTLAVRPPSVRPPTVHRPCAIAQGRNVFGVRSGQLPDAQGEDERDRALQIVGISVLHELLEFPPKRRGQLDRGFGRRGRATNERPNRLGLRRELVLGSVPLEERLFLGRKAHSEKVGRGSWGLGGPHA